MNVLTQTQDLSSKAKQVFDDLYRSIGGSGSNPDIATFRKQVQTAETEHPKEIADAGNRLWNDFLEPLAKNGGGPVPSDIVEQIGMVIGAWHRGFSTTSTGART